MVKDYAKICDSIYNIAKGQATAAESKLLFGEVKSVNPLEIKLVEHDNIILDSESVYLTDNVIVKKVRMSIHRIYGEPEEVQFQGNANDIVNNINMLLFNLSKNAESYNMSISGEIEEEKNYDEHYKLAIEGDMTAQDASIEGRFNAAGSVSGQGPFDSGDPTIEGKGTLETEGSSQKIKVDGLSKTVEISNMSKSELIDTIDAMATIKGDVKFHIEFIEKEENQPELDEPEQKMTVRLEGVLHEGLKVEDIVMMTTHNHGQKYLVHRVTNRHRETGRDRMEQYEQSYLWDSRINDVGINESDLG